MASRRMSSGVRTRRGRPQRIRRDDWRHGLNIPWGGARIGGTATARPTSLSGGEAHGATVRQEGKRRRCPASITPRPSKEMTVVGKCGALSAAARESQYPWGSDWRSVTPTLRRRSGRTTWPTSGKAGFGQHRWARPGPLRLGQATYHWRDWRLSRSDGGFGTSIPVETKPARRRGRFRRVRGGWGGFGRRLDSLEVVPRSASGCLRWRRIGRWNAGRLRGPRWCEGRGSARLAASTPCSRVDRRLHTPERWGSTER